MDVFITPNQRSDRRKLLATYATWKDVSQALKEQGEESLHVALERRLVGKRNKVSIPITFTTQDAQLVLTASRET